MSFYFCKRIKGKSCDKSYFDSNFLKKYLTKIYKKEKAIISPPLFLTGVCFKTDINVNNLQMKSQNVLQCVNALFIKQRLAYIYTKLFMQKTFPVFYLLNARKLAHFINRDSTH